MGKPDKADSRLCRVTVDSFRCNACGACVECSPEHFIIDETTGSAKERENPVQCTEALEKAVAFCPRKCIELDDE